MKKKKKNEKKKKSIGKDDLQRFLVAKLRSASRKWPPLYEKLKEATYYVYVDIEAGTITVEGKGQVDEILSIDDYKIFKLKKSGRRKMYECAYCERLFFEKYWAKTKNGKWRRLSAINLDHINPIVPITGWDSYDGFIDRLFNGDTQVLCTWCHGEKTKEENSERRKIECKRTRKSTKKMC